MRKLWLVSLAFCWCLQLASLGIAEVRDASLAELSKLLDDRDVEQRRDAAYELVRRGDSSSPAIAALTKAIGDGDTQVRVQGLIGLARAGEKAQPAIPQLLKCLDNRDAQVRYRAAGALGAIGDAALTPLQSHWASASNDARVAAAQAFARLGAQAQPAIPLLVEGLEGRDSLPRYSAEAIIAIAPQDETVVLQLADHSDAAVRKIGIAALAMLSSPSKTAKQKLHDAVGDADAQIREATVIMLAKSKLPPTEKMESIETTLLDPVASVREAAIVATHKASLPADEFARRLASRLPSVEVDVANSLIKALASLGPGAQVALPALIKEADRENIDQALLSRTMASFGAKVVPDLLSAIEKQPRAEPVFSQALGMIGQPAVEALTLGLTSDVELVRLAATRALGGVRPPNREVLERLSKTAGDPSARVREVAITSLISAGKEADFAREQILSASNDAEPNVRAAALHALPVFDFSDSQATSAIEHGLKDPAPQVRSRALAILSELPKLRQARADQLAAMGKDPDAQVRAKAIETLGTLDAKQISPAIVEACRAALEDDDSAVRLAATESVRALKITDGEVLEALGHNLADDRDLLRVTLEALADFGDKASSMIPAVSRLAAHEKADVRAAALNTLAAIDKDTPQLVGWLTAALDDSQWEVRRIAGVALGKLGPEAKHAVPKLFQLLSSDEDRDFASSSLKEINAAPVEAVGLLIEKLDSEDRRMSFYAVSLLGKIGPPAAEALPKLEAMLAKPSSDPGRSDFRRKFLTEAIAAIKGEAQPDK